MRKEWFYGVVGIIYGGACFCGFIAFEKLKYYARFKVVEASTIKQPRPQSNFKNIAKRCVRDEVNIKRLKSQLYMQTQVVTRNNTAVKGNNLKSKSNIHDRDFRKF